MFPPQTGTKMTVNETQYMNAHVFSNKKYAIKRSVTSSLEHIVYSNR